MLNIRQAKSYESEILTRISIESEAYWGYDADFMEKFSSTYRVTEEFINNNPTFVMEEEGTIIGFYGMINSDNSTFLEYLYIEPSRIGKGYGKLLWNHMVGYCREKGIKEIEFVTSPQAEAFYTKLGAVVIEQVESLVTKGRIIPKLIYIINERGEIK